MALLGAVKRPLCVQLPLPVNVPSWPSAVHSYTHLMLEMQNGKYERSEESVCFQNDPKKLIIDVASAPSYPPLTNGLYSKRQLLKGLDYFYLKFATSFMINFVVKIKWVFQRAPQFLSFPHPRAA